MLTMIFLLAMLFVFGKILVFGIRVSWGIVRMLFSVVFLPIVLFAMILSGLLSFAIPILVLIAIGALLLKD
ncbi:MAG: hypothetical protein MJ116_04860 [Lachnospiraceae bacterium]|nr:hypothetical protein [Lachnospiraceae bacterium]